MCPRPAKELEEDRDLADQDSHGYEQRRAIFARSIGPRKKLDDIFSRLDTIHERDDWTYGRTSDDSKESAYA